MPDPEQHDKISPLEIATVAAHEGSRDFLEDPCQDESFKHNASQTIPLWFRNFLQIIKVPIIVTGVLAACVIPVCISYMNKASSRELAAASEIAYQFRIPPDQYILDNGKIRIGVNAELGHSIGYLAPSNDPTKNVVNSADSGREIQMSFYAGPNPYNPESGECQDVEWNNGSWPWNPIGAGDIDQNSAELLSFEKPNKWTMKTLTRPLQWACHNLPCECTFEQTIKLVGDHVVHVTATLHNNRTDDYDDTWAFPQELPAVYTNGFLHRFVTYNGSNPFVENEPVAEYDAGWSETQNFWFPGGISATEHWAAFVDENDWGLGIINLQVTNVLGGFHIPWNKGWGGPRDHQTGYMAPASNYALPKQGDFSYDYYLVLGTVEEIRSFAKLAYTHKMYGNSRG